MKGALLKLPTVKGFRNAYTDAYVKKVMTAANTAT